MGWARMDDGFHDHPKVDTISLEAVGLWTLCFTHANRHVKTAVVLGHVAEARVQKVAGKRGSVLAAELVGSGLWEIEADLGGWVFHDFEDYLPKRRDSTEASTAGKKGAAARWQKNGKPVANSHDGSHDGDGSSIADAMADDGSRAAARAFPARPGPSPTSSMVNLGGEAGETLQAAPSPNCDEHPNGTSGPCGRCKDARLGRERWDAEAKTRTANAKAAAAAARAACPDCDENGFQIDSDGKPVARCTHRRTA